MVACSDVTKISFMYKFPRDYVPQARLRDKSYVPRAAKNVTEAPVWNNVIASKIVRQFSRVCSCPSWKTEHRILKQNFIETGKQTFANTTKVTWKSKWEDCSFSCKLRFAIVEIINCSTNFGPSDKVIIVTEKWKNHNYLFLKRSGKNLSKWLLYGITSKTYAGWLVSEHISRKNIWWNSLNRW